jgi:hypothetical protein
MEHSLEKARPDKCVPGNTRALTVWPSRFEGSLPNRGGFSLSDDDDLRVPRRDAPPVGGERFTRCPLLVREIRGGVCWAAFATRDRSRVWGGAPVGALPALRGESDAGAGQALGPGTVTSSAGGRRRYGEGFANLRNQFHAMSSSHSPDEQVKIARSSALATWAGVAIATTGLVVSIVTLLGHQSKKPHPPSSTSTQSQTTSPQASQAGLMPQRDGKSTAVSAEQPGRTSRTLSPKQLGDSSSTLRRRANRIRAKAN